MGSGLFKSGFLSRHQDEKQQSKKQEQKPSSYSKEFSFSVEENDNIEKELRKPRSRVYMEMFDAIDMLSMSDEEIIAKLKDNMDEETAEEFLNMSTEELLEEIKTSLREEFRGLSIEVEEILHGVLSKCYIDGCDCHAISGTGQILDHYTIESDLPKNLQKGRSLIQKYPDCRCVEVYSDCCRVIGYDSSVTKILNKDIKE